MFCIFKMSEATETENGLPAALLQTRQHLQPVSYPAGRFRHAGNQHNRQPNVFFHPALDSQAGLHVQKSVTPATGTCR